MCMSSSVCIIVYVGCALDVLLYEHFFGCFDRHRLSRRLSSMVFCSCRSKLSVSTIELWYAMVQAENKVYRQCFWKAKRIYFRDSERHSLMLDSWPVLCPYTDAHKAVNSKGYLRSVRCMRMMKRDWVIRCVCWTKNTSKALKSKWANFVHFSVRLIISYTHRERKRMSEKFFGTKNGNSELCATSTQKRGNEKKRVECEPHTHTHSTKIGSVFFCPLSKHTWTIFYSFEKR